MALVSDLGYRVVVPAISADCPAALALAKEGISFELRIMETEYDYGQFWTDLWEYRQSFINIEHDVAPWPGAIYELMDCPKPWCAFEYPSAPHNVLNALGCIKIGLTIMNAYPNLPIDAMWPNKRWNELDGAVISALNRTVYDVHLHYPPLAHVKR